MSNLTKLEFTTLDITRKNYFSWILDAEIHFAINGLGNTIKNENTASDQDKAKEMIFLHRLIHEGLKIEYLIGKDPLVLWNNLNERYDHLKTIILPKAQFEWLHLRIQDFKSVSEHNSALFRITSQLKLRGETITNREMLEKTFSTFHECAPTTAISCKRGQHRSRGRGRGHFSGHARENSHGRGGGGRHNIRNDDKKNQINKTVENKCYHCGMKGH
ncbi:uncharacterized protein LOC124915929 [Impatiens glandulifera]|uniref:uncharacterized protein LOC124915929 n=1 Tax=Impatiens glandulifera TaxID=253017 RepID=UPI001FB121A1|nr:uncharacterized protein LOC124915929 [Impatiens glandulifera]